VTNRATKPAKDHWRASWEAREPAVGAPSAATATKVWEMLAPALARKPAELLPAFLSYCDLTPDEEVELAQTAQQALVVALDVFVRAAQDRQPVSLIRVFDALAARWSAQFRAAQAGCPGLQSARDMTLETVNGVREDLLYTGINFEAIWKIVADGWSAESGPNPLYAIIGKIPQVGLRVWVRSPEAINRFESIIAGDPGYVRPPERRRALLFASDPIPERQTRQKFAGEQPYDVVEVGARAKETLDRLEQTTLVFNVSAFKADYQRYLRVEQWRRLPWKHREKYPLRRRRAARAKKYVERFARVWEQVKVIDSDTVRIHSGFFRAVNRRFHARHFWVEHVSGKPDRRGTSQRERWFAFKQNGVHVPMRGYDVSASQTQILAVLLGLRDLEQLASNPDKPFKRYLAEQAWQAHLDGRLPLRAGYEKARDLVPLVKELWTRHLYGSKVRRIVKENHGWIATAIPPYKPLSKTPTREQKAAHGRRKNAYNRAIKEATKHVEDFLASLPWYGKPGEGKLSDWFRACRRIAQVCQHAHPYRGAEFIDPYDRKPVRFNPVRRATYRVRLGRQILYISLPGYWKDKAHTDFRDAEQDPATGDYPVRGVKLGSTLAPSLVHMMDAALSAHLLDYLPHLGLHRGTIATGSTPVFNNFVALHDCWLIPETTELSGSLWLRRNNLTMLSQMIQNATVEWFLGLEIVYDRLVDALGRDPEYGPFLRQIREQWVNRKNANDYPHFAVSSVHSPE